MREWLMDDNLICALYRLESYDLWPYALVDAVIRVVLIRERVLHKIYTYLK